MEKPCLKWVGGKTQILEEVLRLFPTEIVNYHEPFLGGGSVLLGFLSYVKQGKIKLSEKVYASDLNSNLIGLYQNIQQNTEVFLAELKALVQEFSGIKGTVVNRKAATYEEAMTSPESYYFWIRSRFNAFSAEQKSSPIGSAMLLFLNKTCFRGLYREGPRGFNVPFGNYKKPSIYDEAHIRSIATLIKDVIFTVRPFADSLTVAKIGDFVYLDPPYAPESEKSFVGYTADGFTLENHKQLFTSIKALPTKGVRFLMSNADVSLVKDSFPDPTYKTKTVECRRAINSKKPESKTNEVLITNG